MSTDDLERKKAQTSGLKRLNKPSETQPKPSTRNLVEQVPSWLKSLLTKYGEKEGRLIGLGEVDEVEADELPIPVPPRARTTGALSNLLEQMAEEGVPEHSRDQLSTSVEWGSPGEPEADTFDDFLTHLGSDQSNYQDVAPTDEAPDWITGIQPAGAQPESVYDPYALPPQPGLEAEAPDWLTEMMGPSAAVAPPPPVSPQVGDAPDWLTEALETPSSRAPLPPAASSPSPPASSTDTDVPDWLTAALEIPAAPAQTPSPAPPQASFDIPDWLAETPAEPELPETFSPPGLDDSPADETPYAMDVPDWLGDIVSPPGLEETNPTATESEVDVPDWLADIAPPLADEVMPSPLPISTAELPDVDEPDWFSTAQVSPTQLPDTDAPDWLSTAEVSPAQLPDSDEPDWLNAAQVSPTQLLDLDAPDLPATDTESQAVEESAKKPATPTPETSSWFAQAEGLPSLDWLFEEEPAPPATMSKTEAPAQEQLDWLFDSSGATPAASFETPAALETAPSQTGEAIPAWWEDTSVSSPIAEAEAEAVPGWLEDIQEVTETPEAGQPAIDWPDEAEETPSWWAEADAAPEVSQTNEADTQPVSSLRNLKSLKRVSPQSASPAEPEPSPPLPGWAANLVPAGTETGQVSPALPDWAANLIPPGATQAEPVQPVLPDWAKVLLPPDVETKPAPSTSEPPEKPAPRLLQRLSGISKSPPEPPAPLPAAETPDWLTATPVPIAAEDETSTESPDWMSDLSATGTDEPSNWLTETEPPTSESPDWLGDTPTTRGEVPDWMAELTGSTPQMPEASTGMDDFPEETLPEEGNLLAERLDWFTQDRPEEEAVPAPTQAWTPSTEPEIPDWLTGTMGEASPAAPALPPPPAAEEASETWDWLTDLPAPTAGEEPSASLDETEMPAGREIPDWLADTAPSVTPSAPMEPVKAEADAPAWLTTEPSETSPVAWSGQTEPEAEFETPAWFSELPETSAAATTSASSIEPTETDLETPPWLAGLSEETLETPDWWTELPETPAAGTPPPSPAFDIETEIDEDLEKPSWLTDLLDTHDPEASLAKEAVDKDAATAGSETPPWLAQWPGMEATPAISVEEDDSDLEMPSWLADLGKASETQTPFPTWAAEAEEGPESEGIPWLTLSPPSVPETEAAASVEESDVERASPAWPTELPEASTTETGLTGLVEETEEETPAWFDELTEADAPSPSWPSQLVEAPETEATRAELLPAADPEIPSWLAGLREMTETEAAPESTVEEFEPQAEPGFSFGLSELPADPGSAGIVEGTEEDELEIPSWLSELSEAPVTEGVVKATDAETLSWLTDLPEAVEAVEETEAAAYADLEMPSWLADLPEAVEVEPVPVEAAEEPEAELEMPAWLSKLPTAEIEPAQVETGEIETRAEIPSWLTDLPEAVETEAEPVEAAEEPEAELEMPAWLSELPAAEAELAQVETSEIETRTEMPSWLAGLPEAAEAIEEPEAEAELEMPAWLSELPAAETEPAQVETGEIETRAEMSAWLTDLPETAEEPEAEAELEMPTWLSELPTAEIEPAQVETGEIETRAEMPSWLTDLPEAVETEAEPVEVEEAQAEAELEMPAWLSELPATEAELAQVETGETAEAELETPVWLSEMVETPVAEAGLVEAIEEPEAEAELEMPAWLSELPAAEIEPAQVETGEIETRAEMPAWLADLPEAVETVEEPEAEAELEMPAWLSELPAAETESTQVETSEIETRAEIPAWLADLPEAVEAEPAPVEAAEEAEAELEMPAWLSELPAAETESTQVETSEIETRAEMPGWLADLPEAVEAAEEPEAELEMPAWLSELPAAEIEPAQVETSEIETRAEMPGWLTDLPEAVEAIEEPEAEAELEMPAWLSELPAAETESARFETGEIAEAELETPAWLSEMVETSVAEAGLVEAIEEPEAEAELEMPAWLSELPAAETESARFETGEIETRTEMPGWLAGLPEAAEAIEEPEAEAELEMPAWLSELPAAETEPAQVETGETAEAELETPVWLSEMVETPVAEIELVPVEEPEVEAELEMPAWLSELPAAETEPAQVEAGETAEAELETLAWPSEMVETPLAEVGPVEVEEVKADLVQAIEDETPAGAELDEIPPWLADLSADDLKLPSWLSDTPEFAVSPTVPTDIAEAELETPPEQQVSLVDSPVEEAGTEPVGTDETAEIELPVESDWLAGLGAATAAVKAAMPVEEVDEAPDLPAWLADAPQTAETAEATALEASPESEAFVEPEAPDWLKDSVAPLAGGATAETLQTLAEPKPSPAERMSDWLRTMKPSEETLTTEDNQVAESTGVLAGLAPLLPVEKIASPMSLLTPQAGTSMAQADAMLEATHHFYAIATQRPQPMALPEPLTRRDQLAGNMIRGVLYLLFIVLVALPLIPRLQKVVDPTTGQKAAWTEPSGLLSEVLDKQRRELVSAQLGVIDLQQPGSVALVSFDYSTATQGEMQPLAEDIIGRLRGQGVRLIFVSLEPEGATLAQQTLDQLLAARNETYGAEMVNLGYIPGQIAGIRELVTGRKQLSTLADFKEGLTFAAPERITWNGINNLAQVDVVITLSDNPATARWWIEQMATAIPPDDGERYLLAGSSATTDPFLRPYLDSQQLDGLISGINGAAAIEAGRKSFGPARQMLDSQGIAHLLIVILIALGTMFGWMPPLETKAKAEAEVEVEEAEVETET